jgi:hypothetical protein
MPRFGATVTVVGPTVGAPVQGLIASSQTVVEADPQWEVGYTWAADPCWEATVVDALCDDEGNPLPTPVNGCDEFPVAYPYRLQLAARLSVGNKGTADWNARVERALNAATSKALETAVWTGAGDEDNTSFDEAGVEVLNVAGDDGWVPLPTMIGLAAMVQALSTCGPGGPGMIHTPPHLGVLWSDWLVVNGARLYTKVAQHIVVPGGGYPGTGPEGDPEFTPPPGTVWVMGHPGQAQVRLGPVENLGEVYNRAVNDVIITAERFASVAYSTCCRFAALVAADFGVA